MLADTFLAGRREGLAMHTAWAANIGGFCGCTVMHYSIVEREKKRSAGLFLELRSSVSMEEYVQSALFLKDECMFQI